MDDLDLAQERAELHLNAALTNARGKSTPPRTAAELPVECINGCEIGRAHV